MNVVRSIPGCDSGVVIVDWRKEKERVDLALFTRISLISNYAVTESITEILIDPFNS